MLQVAPKAKIVAFEQSAFTFEVLKTCIAWHRIADPPSGNEMQR